MAKHCWHAAGYVLTSSPPQFPFVCCQCGKKVIQRQERIDRGGHGPFVQVEPLYRREPLPDGPCSAEGKDGGR